MSLTIQPNTIAFIEELDDMPPETSEGLAFEILGAFVSITPFEGRQMFASREDIEQLQSALLNYLNTGYFDPEG